MLTDVNDHPVSSGPRRLLGAVSIVFAVLFNVPYAVLAVTFDYPAILRRPPGEILEFFAQGGAGLILTWHAFALSALALAPFAIALSITRDRLWRQPGLAVGAAVLGALAGVMQAVGLWRWVFVTPALARTYTDPAASADAVLNATHALDLMNRFGGVAIGEHLGQTLTALFVACVAGLQWREKSPITATIGMLAALAILAGTGEGLAIALGAPGDLFSLATIAGFLGLTVWLIATGIALVRLPAERPGAGPEHPTLNAVGA